MNIKIRKAYRRQKNITKSFRMIAAATAVIIFAFLLALYTLGVGILRNNVKKETLSAMDTVENNIFQSSTSIREFVKYLYSKDAFKSIIVDDNENMEEISLSINKALTETSIVMPYIHSIQFYNGITDKMYYTGRGSLADAEREKREIRELKNSSSSFDSVLRSVNIHRGNSNVNQNVISYFMYSEIENNSFIVFNIDISWIYDCIKTSTFSEISLLLDGQGSIIKKNTIAEDTREIEEIIQKNGDNLLCGYGSIIGRINGKRNLIICKKLSNLDITVFKAYPLREIYSMINKFRMYVIIIGILFEAIILLLNMFFTNKIYEPILEFINMVHTQIGGNDDLIKTKNIVRKYEYQSEIETQESELWHAICNNNDADRERTEGILKKYGIDISRDNVVAAVLEIENYYNLCVECSKKEINALMYGIYNAALEMICGKFQCVGINGVNGTIILLITVDGKDENVFDELRGRLAELSEIIFTNLEVSVSSYISGRISDAANISGAISELMNNKVYKYNYGSMCCILPQMIKNNIENPKKNISEALMSRFRDDIINRKVDDIETVILLIADEIRKMDYYAELPQLLYTAKEAEDLFGRMSAKNLFDVKGLSRDLIECEYLDEARDVFSKQIKKSIMEILIEDKLKSENSIKNIAKLAKEIIETEYSDLDLCVDYIADKLGVHSRKLSTGFKDAYNMSIVEYINNLRLEKSIAILKEKKVSVKDVVSMVGFGSEAYYYRVFKKRYGTTPLKYIELNNDKQNESEGF